MVLARAPERVQDPPTGSPSETHLAHLTSFLADQVDLWRPRPFALRELPWEGGYPEVAQWLRRLPEGAVQQIEESGELPAEAPDALRHWHDAAQQVSALPTVSGTPLTAGREILGNFTDARKRDQVLAFCGAVRDWLPAAGDRVVDWCAGRGHTGRVLAHHTGLPVLSLERQAGLCATGQALADRCRVKQHLLQADVLAPETWAHLRPGTVAIGLHACGILTTTLLREAARRQVVGVAVAPCCHHYLNRSEWYEPLSAAGRQAGLRLSSQDLRLSTADDVVACPRVRAARRREDAFRLGFDLLVREATGVDQYVSAGLLPGTLFSLTFERFCQEVAARRGMVLPGRWSAAAAEAAGYERCREARALATVRACFRRPLEVWVVLERALFLAESGYRVSIGTFCRRSTTPRNILVLGHLQV